MKKKTVKPACRARAYFSGRVQGVGFRHEAESIAHRLGLMGWVKNLHDGRVEIVCEGDRRTIDVFFAEIQSSSLGRHIKNVACSWEEPTGEFNDFCVEFCY